MSMNYKADVSEGRYTLHTQVWKLPLKLLRNKNIRIIFKKTAVVWADMFYSDNSTLIQIGLFCTFAALNVTTDWLDSCVGGHTYWFVVFPSFQQPLLLAG